MKRQCDRTLGASSRQASSATASGCPRGDRMLTRRMRAWPPSSRLAWATSVRACPGQSSALTLLHSESGLCGAFVWAHRARDSPQNGGFRPGQWENWLSRARAPPRSPRRCGPCTASRRCSGSLPPSSTILIAKFATKISQRWKKLGLARCCAAAMSSAIHASHVGTRRVALKGSTALAAAKGAENLSTWSRTTMRLEILAPLELG